MQFFVEIFKDGVQIGFFCFTANGIDGFDNDVVQCLMSDFIHLVRTKDFRKTSISDPRYAHLCVPIRG